MDWNEERVATLTKLWREGYSASQVARQLGAISRSGVIGKVHRLGIAGRDAPSHPHSSASRPSHRVRATAGGQRRAAALRAQPTEPQKPRAAFEVAPTATIVSLAEHGCRWPIGDPGEAGFGFCGRIKSGVGAYCAGHAPMAVRRRDAPFKAKDIDRLVTRFAEGGDYARPLDTRWRDLA